MAIAKDEVVTETVTITEKMIEQFAEVSGDYNPIHMDEAYAKTTRFGRRIAHGMLSAALISRVLANRIDVGGIYLAQSMKFMNPIFIDDVVTIELRLASFRAERGIAMIETLVKNQKGETCVKGEATIMSGKKVVV